MTVLAWLGVLAVASALPCAGAVKVLVTVVDPKTGLVVKDLKAEDFVVTDGDAPRRVEGVGFETTPVDVMLLVDSSLAGQAVQGAAGELIQEIKDKEQMALVAYHSSADLLQDFTSSKASLLKALTSLKYGNEPRALDGIYAAADGGFEHALYRRVILLLTAGYEGGGRVSERSVIQLCRRNAISIHTLYLAGQERGLFETLARRTGGVALNMRNLSKATNKPAGRVFDALRNHYTMTISGNLAPTEKFKVEIRGRKLFAGARAEE